MYRRWRTDDHDALTERVLAVLPGPGEEPQSTPGLRQHFKKDLDAYAREVYVRQALDRLVKAGLAERIHKPDDQRAFWRRTPLAGRQRGGARRDVPATR